METIFQATKKKYIVSCFKLVIKKLLVYSSVECKLKTQHHFSEWEQEDPKESWKKRSGCLADWVTGFYSFSGSFIHSFICPLIYPSFFPPFYSRITHPPLYLFICLPIYLLISPSICLSTHHPSSLHHPPILPSTDPLLNITSA